MKSRGYLRWIIGYSVAIAVVAGIAVSSGLTPRIAKVAEKSAPPQQESVFRTASLSPLLDGSISSAPRGGLLAASDAIAPVGGAFGQRWYDHFAEPKSAVAAVEAPDDAFDAVVKEAAVSPARLAALFARTKTEAKRKAKTAKPTTAFVEPVVASLAPVKLERLAAPSVAVATAAPAVAESETAETVVLAYADPSPTATNEAIAAVVALARVEDETAAAASLAKKEEDVAAATVPTHSLLPDAVPLPLSRPEVDEPTRKLLRAEKPAPTKEVKLAFAKPNVPLEEAEEPGSGRGFKNLFGRPKAGRGVAIYDISAAKVYMPDGTVLEAHSGIGKMADDPRYVKVKMNGPTPPHTYNLKMREARFHGVEAIRMLPVDGRNKHGRDGFLTHSYLLRGGRAESHGCVAFKDYDKFLRAFKAGKIKQLIVVPGAGKAKVRYAKNGSDA